MNLSIMAPHCRLFNGLVNSVVLPGELGPFQVFLAHAATLSSLVSGKVTYSTVEGVSSSIDVKSGFVAIARNQITVVCEPVAQ